MERALIDGTVGDTKTGERRTVDTSRELADELRDYLTWRKTETLRCGWSEPPQGPVLQRERPRAGREPRAQIMARVCEHAEIAHRTPYDLRHTFATLLLSGQAAGLAGHPAPLTYVAGQLGHTKPTTTLA